jgi:SAM-dependent methyltransferase
VAFLERLRDSAPGGNLLDVGCGEGRHSVVAAQLGFKVTAIDYEPLALERAREFARANRTDGIVFRTADVFSLPFPASRFDIVVDYGCLHHQTKSRRPSYTASILRVLKPQGFYVLSVFSPRFRMFRGSKRRWHIAHGAYRRCFTADEIVGLFGRRYEIVEMIEERGEGRGFWHALMKRRAAT